MSQAYQALIQALRTYKGTSKIWWKLEFKDKLILVQNSFEMRWGGVSKKIVENSYDEKLYMLIFIRGSLWTVFKGSPVGQAWLQLHFTSQATHGHGDQKGLKAMVCKWLGFTPRESWVQPCYGASCKQTQLVCTQSAEGQGHHHGAECITEQVARSEFKGRRKVGMCRGGDVVQAKGTASTQAQRQEETSVEVRTEIPPVARASTGLDARGQNGRMLAYGEDSMPAGGVNLVTKVQ